jgi:hypothetical protein
MDSVWEEENAEATRIEMLDTVRAAESRTSGAGCVGRFLPFAIYSQTDSLQECQSNEKYHETKLFSCQKDHQGYTFDTNIDTSLPPASP